MPKYFVQTGTTQYSCDVKVTDMENAKTYTFFINDDINSVIQIQKNSEGGWRHPTGRAYNLEWVDQLAHQVDSGKYW